jgi:hypothetical protein
MPKQKEILSFLSIFSPKGAAIMTTYKRDEQRKSNLKHFRYDDGISLLATRFHFRHVGFYVF